MKAMPMRGQRTATNKAKANPFGKGESMKMEKAEGKKSTSFKPCPGCKSPAKCKAAGKCMAKGK